MKQGVAFWTLLTSAGLQVVFCFIYEVDEVKRYSSQHMVQRIGELKKCHRNVYDELMKIPMLCTCKPRPTIVNILSDNPSIMVIPRVTMVNRCSGKCYGKKPSCMSVKTSKLTLSYWVENFLKEKKCGVMELEEDTECSCGCPIKSDNCNENQVYDGKNCKCTCKDERKLSTQCKELGRQWDYKMCRCICMKELSCSSGLEWIPSLCSCRRVISDEEEEEWDY